MELSSWTRRIALNGMPGVAALVPARIAQGLSAHFRTTRFLAERVRGFSDWAHG